MAVSKNGGKNKKKGTSTGYPKSKEMIESGVLKKKVLDKREAMEGVKPL